MMKSHLAHMIRRQAQRYGTREVFRHRNKNASAFQSMSWTEFIAEVDRVALAFDDRGCRQGENIGIISANRPEWLIADMAIHTLGAVVVPFFANMTKEQMLPMVEETGMRLLFASNREQLEKGLWLTTNSCLETVVLFDEPESGDLSRCLSFRALKPGFGPEATERIEKLLDRVSETDLATIIYTSGTTGEPKGAMLGHDNFMTTFPYHDRRLNVTEDDVSLCFLPLSHIFERSWSYYMLHCGVVNVMLENPREVIDVLPVAKPTLMCTVPRFFDKTYEGIMKTYITWPAYKRRVFDWAMQLGHKRIEFERRNKPLPTSISIKTAIAEKLVYSRLRAVLGGRVKFFPCSGAAISPKLLRFFHAAGICVLYGYGATETTATVSCFKHDEYEFDSCGTVLPGVSVRFGDDGEILVKGTTVFRGYYKKPEETAKVLNDGWYHTGDQGYLTPEGNLAMTERLRDIFKTSVGKYVSPQKLELLLTTDDLIEQCIVFGDNRKFITALIVPDMDKLRQAAHELNKSFSDTAALLASEEINRMIRERINHLQQTLTPYERVVDFRLLAEPFSIENKALTHTLKIKRSVIGERYRRLIDSMYL